ncbi:MAG TPA: hypothetical protein VNV85_13715 [Puia sp.]|nr:hypothetical protein [Puia sp.]
MEKEFREEKRFVWQDNVDKVYKFVIRYSVSMVSRLRQHLIVEHFL